MKLLGLVMITSSLWILYLTERCRRKPESCRDGFMSKEGFTRSFVALRYIGRANEAREAIVRDEKLRKWYLIEGYCWVILGLGLGIAVLIFG